MISSKIEIINHFDNLIQRVDIDIEECLIKYNEEHVLGDLKSYKSNRKDDEIITRINQKRVKRYEWFKLSELSLNKSYEIEEPWLKEEKAIEEILSKRPTNEIEDDSNYDKIYKTVDFWSESTKIVDYLNQVRMRTIEELREAQKETLEIYKSQKGESNRQLLPDKFYFQVCFTQSEPEEWIFKVFTFATDFYMSPNDISLLEKFINAKEDDYKLLIEEFEIIFDEKMILIGLLQKHFFENLKYEKFPSHVIRVRKQDLSTIKQIKCDYFVDEINLTNSSSIDLSNLESLQMSKILGNINIDGLSSLESLYMIPESVDRISIKNLSALRNLEIHFLNNKIDSYIQSQIIDNLPTIEYLSLNGLLSNFNLDSLVNLKSLSIWGEIDKDFNFGLFNIICNQLENLEIDFYYIDKKSLDKLFFGHHFPYLKSLSICSSENIVKIENKLLDEFTMILSLNMSYNNIREIDTDAFSNLKQLISLDLSSNSIRSLENVNFSGLINLKYLDLGENKLKKIEANLFSNFAKLRVLDLSCNKLETLDPKSFSFMKNLKWLSLNDNRLVQFDLSIMDYIKEIKKMFALENPIINRQEILDRCKDLNIELKI